mmetsp:Transcript_10674/g.12479  ORF Transcript_10674/g.12479 Transcript_10674/m.12479 type:complete len:192 (+) Transcript_10674:255-830(+)
MLNPFDSTTLYSLRPRTLQLREQFELREQFGSTMDCHNSPCPPRSSHWLSQTAAIYQETDLLCVDHEEGDSHLSKLRGTLSTSGGDKEAATSSRLVHHRRSQKIIREGNEPNSRQHMPFLRSRCSPGWNKFSIQSYYPSLSELIVLTNACKAAKKAGASQLSPLSISDSVTHYSEAHGRLQSATLELQCHR